MKRTRDILLELFFRFTCRRERRALLKMLAEHQAALTQGDAISTVTAERLEVCERRYARAHRRSHRVFEAMMGSAPRAH